jgi:hypothetical protein
MANPKVAMRAELEAKFRAKYEEKLKQVKAEFEALLIEAHANYQIQLKMGMQQAADAAMMAADDVFDVNAYSAEKFHVAMIDYVNDMSKLAIEDSKTDPDLTYTKADIDRRLLQIVGADNFAPWDERYGGKLNG